MPPEKLFYAETTYNVLGSPITGIAESLECAVRLVQEQCVLFKHTPASYEFRITEYRRFP